MQRRAERTLFHVFFVAWIALLGLFVPCTTVLALSGTNSTQIPVATGSLVSYISSFENAVVSTGYVAPTEREIGLIRNTVSMVLTALSSHDLGCFSAASAYASRVKYEIVNYTDVSSGSYYYMLREKPFTKGYGIFIFNPIQSSSLIVEVPHPETDMQTGSIGIRFYVDSESRAFLMAGARRDAGVQADVAHYANSFFQAVHEMLVSSESIVIQVHGFSQSFHTGYPQAVISTGSAIISSSAKSLEDAFASVGIEAGIYDGSSWADLAGTTNVQRTFTNLVEATFLHVELSLELRTAAQTLTISAFTCFARGNSNF